MNTSATVMSAKSANGIAGIESGLLSRDSSVPKSGYEAFLPTSQRSAVPRRQIACVRPSTPCEPPISRAWANNILDRRRAGERVSDVLVCRALVITGDA